MGRSLDWPGQITIALALLGLLFAVIQGPTSGWGSGIVAGGFIAAVVFLALFIVVELRAKAPLLQLRLFAHRPFTTAAVANVLGMFAYLGTGYATSIRLSAIQGFTPLKTSIAFIALNGMAVVLYPVIQKALAVVNPRLVLGVGLALTAIGDLWLTAVSINDVSVAPLIVPLIIGGAGFALSVSSVAAVTVSTVPRHVIGMASGANGMIRDLGFALAPAVLGAIALSRAASSIASSVAATARSSRVRSARTACRPRSPARRQGDPLQPAARDRLPRPGQRVLVRLPHRGHRGPDRRPGHRHAHRRAGARHRDRSGVAGLSVTAVSRPARGRNRQSMITGPVPSARFPCLWGRRNQGTYAWLKRSGATA